MAHFIRVAFQMHRFECVTLIFGIENSAKSILLDCMKLCLLLLCWIFMEKVFKIKHIDRNFDRKHNRKIHLARSFFMRAHDIYQFKALANVKIISIVIKLTSTD